MQGNAGLALLTNVPEDDITRGENSLRDVIADYIRHNSPVSTKIDDRWVRDDKAEISSDLKKELKQK